MATNDGLVIHAYEQDPDSFGWSIAALFTARYTWKEDRWGILTALTGTENGAEVGSGDKKLTRHDVIRNHWHLVDWFKTEQEARDAYTEARSRIW